MKAEIIRLGFVFILGLALSLYLTPLVAEAARRFGLVARPDGRLRVHKEPVPYMGGVAVYLAFLLALVFGFGFEKQVLGLLLGGTIILLVGLIDDFGVMTPWMKLFGQLVAIIALVKSGIHFEVAAILQLEPLPDFPMITYGLTGFWLMTMMNAFNFLDIEDGLAGGVAFFSGLGLLLVALLNHNLMIATLTGAMLAGTLGFLVYNRAPARIYLGDAGSLFLGLMLGSLAMIGSYTGQSVLGLFAPVLILALPLLEISFTSFARLIQGKPIMQGSADHVAKRLQKLGLPLKATIIFSCAFTALYSGAGLLVMLSGFKTALSIIIASFSLLLVFSLALLRIKVDQK